MDADWLHRLLCVFPGRGDLGLSQRSFSKPRARQGPKPRQFFSLDHERADFLDVSSYGCVFRRLPVRVSLRDDGGAILRRAFFLSGTQGHLARRDAKETQDRVTPFSAACKIGRAHVWTPVTWPSRMPSSD